MGKQDESTYVFAECGFMQAHRWAFSQGSFRWRARQISTAYFPGDAREEIDEPCEPVCGVSPGEWRLPV
jgi:hypothetical protein